MMKHIVLIRHGQTEYNAEKRIQGWFDSPLTDEGRSQATAAAATLTHTPDIIIASDLSRASDTAKIIKDVIGSDAPLLLDWRLRERHFGSLQGKIRDDDEMDELFSSHPDGRPFGAESENSLSDRVWSFIQDLDLIDADTIFVVTHNGVINRFGYLLMPGYTHTTTGNAGSISYDIDPKTAVNEWKKRQEVGP